MIWLLNHRMKLYFKDHRWKILSQFAGMVVLITLNVVHVIQIILDNNFE